MPLNLYAVIYGLVFLRKSKESSSEKESSDGEPSAPEEPPPGSTSTMAEDTVADQSLWKKGVQEVEEMSHKEEFAEYLEDLLL